MTRGPGRNGWHKVDLHFACVETDLATGDPPESVHSLIDDPLDSTRNIKQRFRFSTTYLPLGTSSSIDRPPDIWRSSLANIYIYITRKEKENIGDEQSRDSSIIDLLSERSLRSINEADCL